MSNSIGVNDLRLMLEDAYPVGKIEAIKSITCDEEELLRSTGSVSEAQVLSASDELRSSFRVSTEGGEYFLKRVGTWVKDDQLERVGRFIKWTCDQKLRLCPALITTRKCETHVTMGTDRFQLFEFVRQKKRQLWMNSDLGETDCRLAGELLARFNDAAAGYVCQSMNARTQSEPATCGNWEASVIGTVRGNWNRVMDSLLDEGNRFHSVLAHLRDSREALEDRLDGALALAWNEGEAYHKSSRYGIVHGDFHPGNILFSMDQNGDERAWLVDFDHMHHEDSFFDVGYALTMLSYRPSCSFAETGSVKGRASIDAGRTRAFLSGFLQCIAHCESSHSKEEHRLDQLNSARPDLLVAYTRIACFLIIDWAQERLRSGAEVFSDVYARIIGDMVDLLLGEEIEGCGHLYLSVMNEILS